MKRIIILNLIILSFTAKAQKVISDVTSPILRTRTIVTSLAPILKMKVLQVGGLIIISKEDTAYHLGFYFTDQNSQTNIKFDSLNVNCIVLLQNGKKCMGIYENTTRAYGLIIYSYMFSSENFNLLRSSKSTAILLNSPDFKNAEFEIPTKYQDNIADVCANLLTKIKFVEASKK